MKDEGIDRAIRNTLAEGDIREQGRCPDDSRIAAYLDSRLRPEESAEFEAHAARCAACREILALSMRLGEKTEVPQPVPRPRGQRVLFHLAIPVSVLALLVVASGVGVYYYRSLWHTRTAPADTQTADLRIPVKPREPAIVSQAPEGKVPESPASPQQSKLRKGSPAFQGGYSPGGIPPSALETGKDVAPVGAANGLSAKPGNADAPVRLQAARNGMKAESAPESGAPAPGEGGVPQSSVSAARFRLFHAAVTGAPPAAAAEAGIQKATALAQATTAESGGDASRKLAPESAGASSTKRIGDRTFVRTQSVWVDGECEKHPEASVIEILPDSEEYLEILKSYPGLRDLRPVMIFWKGRQLFLR